MTGQVWRPVLPYRSPATYTFQPATAPSFHAVHSTVLHTFCLLLQPLTYSVAYIGPVLICTDLPKTPRLHDRTHRAPYQLARPSYPCVVPQPVRALSLVLT